MACAACFPQGFLLLFFIKFPFPNTISPEINKQFMSFPWTFERYEINKIISCVHFSGEKQFKCFGRKWRWFFDLQFIAEENCWGELRKVFSLMKSRFVKVVDFALFNLVRCYTSFHLEIFIDFCFASFILTSTFLCIAKLFCFRFVITVTHE